MKKLSITVIMFTIGVSFVCALGIHFGNGNTVSAETILPQFERVQSHGNAEVRYHKSQDYRAAVTIDSNLQECIELKVENNALIIRHKHWHLWPLQKYTVDIYCPALTGVTISGSGNFTGVDKIAVPSFSVVISGSSEIDGTFECDIFSVSISGSGNMNANIICNSLSVDIAGSGKMNITGSGHDLGIKIAGSGNFNGIEFKSSNITARVSGSGKLDVWALEYIKAVVTGSGRITYRGNPLIDFDGSGSGSIKGVDTAE